MRIRVRGDQAHLGDQKCAAFHTHTLLLFSTWLHARFRLYCFPLLLSNHIVINSFYDLAKRRDRLHNGPRIISHPSQSLWCRLKGGARDRRLGNPQLFFLFRGSSFPWQQQWSTLMKFLWNTLWKKKIKKNQPNFCRSDSHHVDMCHLESDTDNHLTLNILPKMQRKALFTVICQIQTFFSLLDIMLVEEPRRNLWPLSKKIQHLWPLLYSNAVSLRLCPLFRKQLVLMCSEWVWD